MKVKCKNGMTVETFYDRKTRSSVTRLIDSVGNQVGDADYSGTKQSDDYMKNQMVKENGGVS